MFLDESVRKHPPFSTVVVACCIFPYERWLELSHEARTARRRNAKHQLQAIHEVLDKTNGRAVLVYAANLTPAEYAIGEVDTFRDVPRMSRTDDVWSQLAADAVCTGVAWLLHNWRLGVIDVYYDRKDLTAEHRAAFEKMLRNNVIGKAREAVTAAPTRFRINADHLTFGAIEAVQKPSSGARWDWFQNGTDLADLLCTRSEEVIRCGRQGRLLVEDRTEDTRETLSAFQSG